MNNMDVSAEHLKTRIASRPSDGLLNLRKRCVYFFRFRNECQRKNFIQTCCIYFNFLMLGWIYGQLGTAFPDLQLILGTNVKETSLIFTVNSIGYMTGSLTIGFIYDRVKPLKLLGIVSIINGVISAASPWCSIYGLFLFVRTLDGFLAGGRDSGGNAKIMACWGNEGRSFMLALHFSYSIGGIISPLVTRLFLAPKLVTHALNRNTSEIATFNGSFNLPNINGYNTTHARPTALADVVSYGETKVHMAFLITGILTVASGLTYLVLVCYGFEKVPTYERSPMRMNNSTKSSTASKRVKLYGYQLAVFLFLIGLTVTLGTALECKSFSFVMPFVLLQLKWSKGDGAFLISLMWSFFSFGRISGIFLSQFRFFRPHRIILFSMIIILTSSVGLYIGSIYHVSGLVWSMAPLMSVGISCCFPTFLVWTHENVLKISGKVGGFFQFVGSLGCFLDPLYMGPLIENFSPLCFVYVQIGQCIMSMLLFVSIITWIAQLRQKKKPDLM